MAKRFLLDTHVVIDLANEAGFGSLPAKVRAILEDSDVELLLSVVSEIEIAIKHSLGKLAISEQELKSVCRHAAIDSYPLRSHHASHLFGLPGHHNDPFDRMIIAVAMSDDLAVLSSDRQFRKYKGLRVVWK